jgi:hypothetical protein
VADNDLQELVQRRLLELAVTAEEAARRSQWTVAPETIQHLARGKHSDMIGERLAQGLAKALDVPENRVRRAAGLPLVYDPRGNITTGPHLRLIRGEG